MRFIRNNEQKQDKLFNIQKPPSHVEVDLKQFRTRRQKLIASYGSIVAGLLIVGISIVPAAGLFAQQGSFTISGTVFDTGGTELAGQSGWEVKLIGYNQVLSTTTQADGGYSFTGLSAGEYTVCQVEKMGWNAVQADETGPAVGDCHRVTIQNEGDHDVNFFNQETSETPSPDKGRLTVITHVISDSGGQAQASDFTVRIVGQPGTNKALAGTGVPGESIEVDPGTYHVDTDSNNNYTKFLFGCNGIELGAGESKTCVIIQNDISTVCPFEQKEGRVIVGFPETWHFEYLNAQEEFNNSEGPLQLFRPVPKGTYDITLVSYDDHDQKPEQNQKEEQWYFEGFAQDGSHVITSNAISDLPETQNRLIEKVNTGVDVSQDIYSITVNHKLEADPSNNKNSIDPVCIAFDPVKKDSAEVEVPATAKPEGEVKGDEAKPVLGITKSADVEAVNPGSKVTYSVSITNSGDAPAVNAKITDILPAGFETKDKKTVIVVDREKIDIGETVSISFDVLVPEGTAPGKYTNVVKVKADNFEEIEARHTIDVLQGKVLGETGAGPTLFALWALAAGLIGIGSYQVRKQLRFSVSY